MLSFLAAEPNIKYGGMSERYHLPTGVPPTWVDILPNWGGNKDFFPGMVGRIRNFVGKFPFFGDILSILMVF